MITKTVEPYELLARWRGGAFAGAHVQFLTRLVDTDTGEVLSETIGNAMPVDIGGGKGFPLADMLTTMHADALAAIDTLTAEKVELQAKVTDAEKLQQDHDALTQRMQDIEARAVSEVAEVEADPKEAAGMLTWLKGLFTRS